MRSCAFTVPFLFCGYVAMIFFLNLKGYVLKEHTYLYSSFITGLGDEGGLLDRTTYLKSFSSIFLVGSYAIINSFYNEVAEYTT